MAYELRISDWSSDLCSSDLFLPEQVGDLVGLDRVMEGGDLVSEFVRHIDDQRHFVGAVAMIVNKDVARQHPGDCLHRQVAVDRLAAVVLLLVGDRLGPGIAVNGEIAQPGRGYPALCCIVALRFFSAPPSQNLAPAGDSYTLYS